VRDLAGLPAQASLNEVLAHPKVLAHFQQVLNHLAARATGSANRVARLLLLPEPPSIDKGEVTDKGSINQRAVLKHRDALVQDFHHDAHDQLLKPSV
jgi:feruloyl-CoA synthase